MVTFKFANKKVVLTITVFLLFVVIGILVWFFYFKKEESMIQIDEKKELTEEDKIEILDRMARMGNTNFSKTESVDVINELKTSTTDESNKTQEEKMNLLEALKNKN